jgi:hypothetical protein
VKIFPIFLSGICEAERVRDLGRELREVSGKYSNRSIGQTLQKMFAIFPELSMYLTQN